MEANNNVKKQKGLPKLKSDFLLTTARMVQLITASVALLATVLGLVAVGIYQMKSMSTSYDVKELPPQYVSQGKNLDINIVNKHLQPPNNVRFIPQYNTFIGRLKAGDILGRFEASTSNKMNKFPNDIKIIGGSDGDMFDKVSHPNTRLSALAVRRSFADEINSALKKSPEGLFRSFEIQVLAYDEYENRSEPTTINFKLFFSSKENPGMANNQQSEAASTKSKALQNLALEISTLVDPEGTPKRFAAFNFALTVPDFCRAGDTPEFVSNFRASFEQSKQQLSGANINAFYKGVCEAWNAAVIAENQKIREAENARAQVNSENQSSQNAMYARTAAAASKRNQLLMSAGVSMGVFILVALVLAFLYMERHSKAIRLAVEQIARDSDRKNPDSSPTLM